jgi:hypothetical protein
MWLAITRGSLAKAAPNLLIGAHYDIIDPKHMA